MQVPCNFILLKNMYLWQSKYFFKKKQFRQEDAKAQLQNKAWDMVEMEQGKKPKKQEELQ